MRQRIQEILPHGKFINEVASRWALILTAVAKDVDSVAIFLTSEIQGKILDPNGEEVVGGPFLNIPNLGILSETVDGCEIRVSPVER